MSAPQSLYKAKDEKALMTEIWDPQIADDLNAYVRFTFPWGKKNTPLANFEGPKSWQRDEMSRITEHYRNNLLLIREGKLPLVYRSASASGRGVGKSSLAAWLNMWMMSTRLGSTSITSANTEVQLQTKTWAELGKWHTLAINAHWFERSATSLKPAPWFESALKTQLKIDSQYYYAKALLWSEENPDAFAGAHNFNGLMLLMDEASGIPEAIWRVSEGFFTDVSPNRFWLVFSNPRRATGAFFNCFHTHRSYWQTRNLDARTVEGADLNVLNEIIDKYGDDSDTARIEVKGQFPRHGEKQFISRELIDNAAQRETIDDEQAPIIMGVDVARKGTAKTVLRFRQGRNARVVPPVKLKGKDTMEVADECAKWIEKVNPDAVAIDAGNNGAGVIDRLKQLGFRVHEVWFGSKAAKPNQWANKRAELWGAMRDWLPGACIDNDPELTTDLAGPEWHFVGATDKVILESKEDMEDRGLSSPDDADALMCTFAVRPPRRDSMTGNRSRRTRMARDVDYDILGR